MAQVILDVETKKTFDEVGGYFPERLGISFVGVCRRSGRSGPGEMLSFFEEDLDQLFPVLERAEIIIGYNLDGFDLPAFAPYYQGELTALPSLDLLARIKASAGHRIGLDAVAKETLNVGKSGDGLDAIHYYRTGQLDKLRQYCLQDVAVTRDLFDHGLARGHVKFRNKWNRLVKCNVDFSYQLRRHAGVQMSLV
ncbi:MAG: hypothetical protein COU69_03915 [Candidatus Pacebacteria bacterium CG10_big_fil_rev_8_21_14_0_10_56_10]|nr:MAG: hypothetical protein COU69_03915 [Candidatus Pacebacteria bacterium CG10_big_fil_rev_8_21_14_0_10_56_10]